MGLRLGSSGPANADQDQSACPPSGNVSLHLAWLAPALTARSDILPHCQQGVVLGHLDRPNLALALGARERDRPLHQGMP